MNNNVITFGASTRDSTKKKDVMDKEIDELNLLGYRKTNRSFLVKLLGSMTESLMHAKDCYNRVLGKILVDFSLDRQCTFC